MSRIQMRTLAPVHVGSGNFLQYNTEFFETNIKNSSPPKRYLRVVDDRKVLNLIGDKHLDDWLLSIERKESVKELVGRYAPQSKVADYSKRRIGLFCDVKNTDTLKECIHDGLGVPYIPGSSIKGAIRTAVLASMADKIKDLSDKIRDNRGKISAAPVEKELFGKDPQSDVFRFLQVGDACFEKGSEIALRLVMGLNITMSNKTLLPNPEDSKPQLVEAIAAYEKTTFRLKLMPDFGKKVDASVAALFRRVNTHTDKLINEEIRFWHNYDNRTGADEYIERMEEILSETKNCQAGECVLRIGHASGWRFITGAWTERLSNFNTEVVDAARPGNQRKYSEYDFPKSRRTDSDGDLLGFVKLKVLE